ITSVPGPGPAIRARTSESPAPEKEGKETAAGRKRGRNGGARVSVKDEDGASSGVENAASKAAVSVSARRRANKGGRKGSTEEAGPSVPQQQGGALPPGAKKWESGSNTPGASGSASYNNRTVDEDYDEGVDALMGLANASGNVYRGPPPPSSSSAPPPPLASMPPPPRPPSRPTSRASNSSHRSAREASLAQSQAQSQQGNSPPSYTLKRPHSGSDAGSEGSNSNGSKRARMDVDVPPSLPPYPAQPERRASASGSGSGSGLSPVSARSASGQASPRGLGLGGSGPGGGESMRLPPITSLTPPKSPGSEERGSPGERMADSPREDVKMEVEREGSGSRSPKA
ncbi:hypothetical protein M422DRAFT_256963, partial [Sphaerobolus stellatus SS14]